MDLRTLWLECVLPVAVVVLGIASLGLTAQLYRALRVRHPAVWESLGRPILFRPLTARCVHWLWFRGFNDIGDTEVATQGSKVAGATFLAVSLLILWGVSAWLLGAFVIRQ